MLEEKSFLVECFAIGLMGGVAAFLLDDKHSVLSFITNIFVAGFIGCLTGALATHYQLEGHITFFVVGVSGLSARGFAFLYRQKVMHYLGLDDDDKKDRKGKK